MGGGFTAKLDYGIHSISLPYEVAILEKVCVGVAFRRALVFDLGSAAEIRGLRISPMAVVLKPKFCIVHDLKFAHAGGRTGVNNDTTFSSAPTCELGSVLRDALLRVLSLREAYGRTLG